MRTRRGAPLDARGGAGPRDRLGAVGHLLVRWSHDVGHRRAHHRGALAARWIPVTTRHGSALPPDVAAVLREFVNAMGKAGMYPAGHRFVEDALSRLSDVLGVTLETRGSLTLGFTPLNVLLDGTAIEPLPQQV